MSEKKKLTQRKGFQIIITLAVIILFFFTLFLVGDVIIERNYYKSQMLSFCGLAMIQEELIKNLSPDFESALSNKSCDYWLLGK